MLIGIAGPKRSGKDTLAHGLSKALSLPVDSFAAPLRKFVADLLNCSLATLEECKEHPIKWLDGKTPRQLMQTVGTEWGRDMVHPELWLRALLNRVQFKGAIVSDVRFPNEAKAILERGGIVIRLHRDGTGIGDGHISEKPLPVELVSIELENDDTAEQLIAQALQALVEHGIGIPGSQAYAALSSGTQINRSVESGAINLKVDRHHPMHAETLRSDLIRN